MSFLHPSWLGLGLVAAFAAFGMERGGGGTSRRGLWRALLAGTTCLALAGPRLPVHPSGVTVLVVDASASVDDSSRSEALTLVDAASRLDHLVFGDAAASPIGWALDRAAGRAAGGGGRLILLSDGGWNEAETDAGPDPRRDPRLAAADARAAGLQVDVVPLARRDLAGATLLAADHVDRLRQGDALALTFHIAAEAPASAELSLWSSDQRLAATPLDLLRGRQSTVMVMGGLSTGTWVLEARLRPLGNGWPESRLRRGVVVLPPPTVLVLGEGESPVTLARALSADGLVATSGGWDQLSNRLSGLADWDAIVLVDCPAERLGVDQLATLESHVRERGGGLLLTAGPNSFDAGGWKDTLLERVSPLSLSVPPRSHRAPLSLTLLVDRSASMGSVEGRGRTPKIDLARDALLLATAALDPGDRVGVVAFDDVADWLLPPAVLGATRERSEIEAMLAGLNTAGGTGIGAALDLALPIVGNQTGVASRHLLLVTDGQDFAADRDRLVAAVDAARRSGMTLSTIAVGEEADVSLLERLAAAGGGRFHAAAEPSDLPAMALAESQILRSRAEQRGSFRASPPPGPWQPLLAGVDVADLPALTAYRALATRVGLRPALETSGGDPLLVSRPWGLGEVAAWASGVDDDWAPGWLASKAGRGLLSGAVRQVARPPGAAPPLVYVQRQSSGLRLGLMADRPLITGDITVSLRTEQGRTLSAAMEQVAAGRYEVSVPVPPGEVWPATVDTGGAAPDINLALSAAMTSESVPGETRDDGLLAEIATAGGGRILTAQQAKATLQGAAPPQRAPSYIILALLALLWTAEVAWLTRGRSGRTWARAVSRATAPASPLTGDRA